MTTTIFLLLSVTATALASGLILFCPSPRAANSLARAFYSSSVTISLAAFLFVILTAAGLPLSSYIPIFWFNLLIYRGWVVVGSAVASACILLLNAGRPSSLREPVRSFVTSPFLLKGISFSIALSFLATEVGKLAHQAEMRQFFVQSGFPVWFLYFHHRS